MKRRVIFTIFIILTLLWASLIFYMSAQPAVQSDDISLTVGRKISSIFVPGFDTMSDEEQAAIAEKIDHPVRKGAHMAEYAILALLLCADFSLYRKVKKTNFIAVLITCAFYAATDEIHQLFVPGRAGMVKDVIIDCAGALIAVILFWAVAKIRDKKKSL